jgi:hypothetical protein
LCELDDSGTSTTTSTINAMTSNETRGVRLDIVIDSGASTCALPPEVATDYPMRDCEEVTPNSFRAASGHMIEPEGARTLGVQTVKGKALKMNFTVMSVKRPLAAVSAITKMGHRVIFDGPENSCIEIRDSRRRVVDKVKLHDRAGIYVLPAWVTPYTGNDHQATARLAGLEPSGFTRPPKA